MLFSPDIFQVCCNTWNSSLNRRELFEHLRIAHSKGGMVFQGVEAEKTRRFLKAILDGKGLRAEATLRTVPTPQDMARAAQEARHAHHVQQANKAAECAVKGLPPPAPVPYEAGMAGSVVHLPPTLPTLQSLPGAHSLFLAAVSRAEPMWFHPSLSEQLSMGLDSKPAAAAGGAAAAAPAAAASATTSAAADSIVAASAAGVEGSQQSQALSQSEDNDADDESEAPVSSHCLCLPRSMCGMRDGMVADDVRVKCM